MPGFVQLMLDIFYPVCRDLLELQRLLREMLPKVVGAQLAYHESAVNGNKGRMELHAVALPVLKDALQRQFYSVCAVADVDGSALDGAAAVATADDRDDRRSRSTVFELPLYTKYLREFDLLLYPFRHSTCKGECRASRVHKRAQPQFVRQRLQFKLVENGEFCRFAPIPQWWQHTWRRTFCPRTTSFTLLAPG